MNIKAKIRKTREIVEIIAFNGVAACRKSNDYVSYIDSKGVEHPIEELNYYWDFIPVNEVVDEVVDDDNNDDDEDQKYEDNFDDEYPHIFNVGDFIVKCDGYFVKKILDMDYAFYELENIAPVVNKDSIPDIDEVYELWKIDAHAFIGDILVEKEVGTLVMFKNCPKDQTIPIFEGWCSVENGKFVETPKIWSCKDFIPASEDECDTFFHKMDDAGYEWRDGKLKRISE